MTPTPLRAHIAEAIRVFQSAKTAYGLGKAANAGVATSTLEMQQNVSRDYSTHEYTEGRVKEIMNNLHMNRFETAAKCGCPGDYVMDANIAI
ncbi:MAG: hypothetical protein AB7S56_00040 [Halothiobacillaceae bacterium]